MNHKMFVFEIHYQSKKLSKNKLSWIDLIYSFCSKYLNTCNRNFGNNIRYLNGNFKIYERLLYVLIPRICHEYWFIKLFIYTSCKVHKIHLPFDQNVKSLIIQTRGYKVCIWKRLESLYPFILLKRLSLIADNEKGTLKLETCMITK